ncbi:carboxypeptidase-like regulatory domain-containing protein [Planctomycetes bacterium Poly30]|uniref:carboxypeptidase-like regulatory domain-containing protein n=1 Tax=Saltatorellus ferox TaxID=2528018 RepID=UPI00119F8E2A
MLSILALGLLLFLGWRFTGTVESHSTEWVPSGAAPSRTVMIPADESLVDVVTRPAEVHVAAGRQPLEAAEAGVERPPGFGELVIRVLVGGKPDVGALVQLDEGVDALVSGLATEDGHATTDRRGEVAFYVRPTRTARVSVSSPGTGFTLEGSYTTPFGGRTRVVVIELGPGKESTPRTFKVTSELDGSPLVGARVVAATSDGAHTVEAETDGEGVARLFAAGQQTYEVWHEGFATAELLAAEDQQAIQVELRPLTRFHGQLSLALDAAADPSVRYGVARDGSTTVGPGGRIRILPFTPPLEYAEGQDPSSRVIEVGSWETFQKRRFEAYVQADGSWSAEVAIPPELEEWTDVSILQTTVAGTHRTIATVPRARPGDVLFVSDPWASEPPLSLRFQSPLGEPVGGGLRVTLAMAGGRIPGKDAVVTARIRPDGELYLLHLPQQVWNYSVDVPGLPKAWRPSGTFQHAGGGDPIVLTQSGRPLEVTIQPKEGVNLENAYLALTRPGDRVKALCYLGKHRSVGGPAHTFLLVPTGVAAELVLLVPRAPDGDWIVVEGRNHSLRELLRIPVARGQRAIVLRP